MSNDLEKKQTNMPAEHDPADLYESYGRNATARLFEGTLLRFVKGDFLAGPEGEEIPIGAQFVPIMESLAVGWTCWRDAMPVEQEMGLLIDGYQPKRRSELGDFDKELWEQDTNTGQPRDPWQLTNHLVMYRFDDHEIFTFVTGSKGGLGAIGELCKEFGKEMRQRPNQRPVVEIGVDSYQHHNRQFGRIKFPTFPIVGWIGIDEGPQLGPQSTPPNLPPGAAAEAAAEAAEAEATTDAPPTRPAPAARPAAAAAAKPAPAARPTLTETAARSTAQKPAAAAKPTTGKPTAKTGTRI